MEAHQAHQAYEAHKVCQVIGIIGIIGAGHSGIGGTRLLILRAGGAASGRVRRCGLSTKDTGRPLPSCGWAEYCKSFKGYVERVAEKLSAGWAGGGALD